MAVNSPFAREPVPAEQPTSLAELEIWIDPATPGQQGKGWPPDQASYAVMTWGIVSSVVGGIAGAVLTVFIAPGHAGIALAELVLALTAALIIAAARPAQDRARHGNGHGQGNRPGR
jgi:hypothetical protein